MKTLVIHPKDVTTDFLSKIYLDKDWYVISDNISKSGLKSQIKSHDRIIMLGHGTSDGLIGHGRLIIDSSLVYLLREKDCVGIWCNADMFFSKYNLKGFYTGMIISEYDEALMFSLYPFTNSQISESNELFSSCIKESIDSDNMLENVLLMYKMCDNPIVDFNNKNIYRS